MSKQRFGKHGTRPNSKLAVAYLRVSTTTERQDLGATAQRHAIEKWSLASGVEVVAWYVEAVSGGAGLDKRPVLLEALAAVAAHRAGLLVVQKLDRFSREPLTAALGEAELQRHGATLAVADGAGSGSDPTAELVRGILFSVARFEKMMIRARIKAAMAVKKGRRELTGVAPYGFRAGDDGKSLVPDAHETAILAQIRALRAAGLTIRKVQSEATVQGLVGRTGKPFTLAAIHHMVRPFSVEAAE